MINKSNMCILIRDESVDAVFVSRTVLGAQIKFMERLPRDENVYAAVAELMKSADKTPSRVTLCIPRDGAIQRTLRYPMAGKADIGSMIEFEAARHVPLAESERLLAYATTDAPAGDQVVLNLVAARKTEVLEWIDAFAEAGVPVDEAVPLSSLITPELANSSTLLVLSDVQHIELCLYGEGLLQDSQLIRRDAPGFSDERVVVAARQMASKQKSWLGDEGIGRILTGGVVSADGFSSDLGTAFGLHVHGLEGPEDLTGLEIESPLEEALLAASVEIEPTLNLIGDQQRKVPISKRTILISALCLVLVGELVAAHIFNTNAPDRHRKKVAGELKDMRREIRPIQEMKDKNRIFRKQLLQLEQVCGERASSMEIMKLISDALPEDTYLRQLNCSQEEISLRGFSKEPGKLPELVMAMPFVDTISTSDIGSERDGYYEFNLTASLRR